MHLRIASGNQPSAPLADTAVPGFAEGRAAGRCTVDVASRVVVVYEHINTY